jgi:hypothetical protein
MAERTVLVVRHGGMRPRDAYEVASRELADEGLVPLEMNGYSIERNRRTGQEVFFVRVEVAQEASPGTDPAGDEGPSAP